MAPISRSSVFVGKMLGGSTDAVIQGSFVFSFLVGINMNIEAFLYSLPIMVLITFGLVSIGLILASFMESLESFGVIQTFVNLPLFFLSGSIFPLDHVRGGLESTLSIRNQSSCCGPIRCDDDCCWHCCLWPKKIICLMYLERLLF